MLTAPAFVLTLTGPTPCAAAPRLFDADAPAPDRARAVALCRRCPARTDCAEAAWQGQETGVWGGLDDADRQCGTDTAVRRHRALAQTCETCETAHATRVRTRRLNRLATMNHGNRAAYELELRTNTPPCPACRRWMRQQSARRRTRPPTGAPRTTSTQLTLEAA